MLGAPSIAHFAMGGIEHPNHLGAPPFAYLAKGGIEELNCLYV
jgi:hypothetical protein